MPQQYLLCFDIQLLVYVSSTLQRAGVPYALHMQKDEASDSWYHMHCTHK